MGRILPFVPRSEPRRKLPWILPTNITLDLLRDASIDIGALALEMASETLGVPADKLTIVRWVVRPIPEVDQVDAIEVTFHGFAS